MMAIADEMLARRRHNWLTAFAARSLFTSSAYALPEQLQAGFPSTMAHTSQPDSGLTSVGGMSMGNTKPGNNADAARQTTTASRQPKTQKLYFLLLSLLIVVFIAIIIVIRRRNIAKRRRARDSSQSALARDIEGWTPSRAWPGGGWRNMVNRTSRTSRTSREEGLDERGEAPPPYNPGRGEDAARALAEAEATAQARREATSYPLRSQDSAIPQVCETGAQVGIPLRSMVRWSASASLLPNPPEYESAILDGGDRRRSFWERSNRDSDAGGLYRASTNEIMGGQTGAVIEMPREAAIRNAQK